MPRALRLALIAVCVLAAGCGPRPLVPVRLGYVRLPALLPLHPEWSQVTDLDARVQSLAAPIAAPAPLPQAPMPAAFSPPSPTMLYTASGQQSPLELVLKHYLQQQTEDSLNRNKARIARMHKVEARALAQRLNTERERIESQVREERRTAVHQIELKITMLSFRQTALASQIRVYTGQSRADAQLQSDMVGEQIAKLTDQQKQLTEDIRPEVNRRLEGVRKSLQTAIDARIAARAGELQAATNRLADELRARIERQAAGFAERVTSVAPVGHTSAVQLPSPITHPSTDMIAATGKAVRDAQSLQAAAERSWQKQRAFAVDTISKDVYQAAQAEAVKQGWKLVSSPVPGATDITSRIAADLKRRWRE